MDYRLAVGHALLESEAFKISFDPLFTWTSGIKSPVYCDLRALISYVSARRLAVKGLEALAEYEYFDVVAGTATAGIPWAAWLAGALDKPLVYVRSEAKGHGMKKRIEGILDPGQTVLLVEDHISTGGSALDAAKVLREEGEVYVNSVFALHGYGLPGVFEHFEDEDLHLSLVTDYEMVLELALDGELIDETQHTLLIDFIHDMKGWANKHKL